MKRFLIILLSFLFFSCMSTKTKNKTETTKNVNKNSFDSDVISIVCDMTLREKIGQVFLMNFRYFKATETDQNFAQVKDIKDFDGKIIQVVPLNQVNQTVESVIKEYHIGNVILFADNFISTDKSIKMISDLQLLAIKENKIPMLISVDQEGGRVNRIFQTTIFPSAQIIGSTNNPDFAYTQGKLLSEQLNALGVNLDFAPVCDVNSNSQNIVIGDRSFSSDPIKVALFSTELYKGLKEGNVIACAKHFPGHGDTEVDSHINLPKINKRKSQWKKCESIPYEIMIKEKIPVIMTAHIQYPRFDNSKIIAEKTKKSITRPATLSKKILTNILREELGFNGVICTDALDMKAISDNFSESQAVIESLNAGADLLCHPISVTGKDDIKRLENLYKQIEKTIENGTLLEEQLNNAVLRIVQLKKNYGLLIKSYKPATEKDIQSAKEILNSSKYNDFLQKLK